MRVAVCRFIIMCLSIFGYILCGYIMKSKNYCREEVFAIACVSFMFDFWATFGQ